MMHHTQGWQRQDWLAVAALAGLACVFWGNCLWGGKVPVAAVYQAQMLPWSAVSEAGGETRQWDSLLWDSMAQFYPWRLLLHKAGQQGELPLWNPYQFCGYPFVGNGQSAMFYPPNWLYFIIHPKIGMGLSAALHYFLGSLFVFGLARRWRLGTIPAVFSAVAFTYGGFVVTWIELPTLVNSLIWLPLAWWGIEVLCRSEGRSLSRPAAGGLLMLAIALGMTLLAGHFQIAAYVWLFTVAYALIRLTGLLWIRQTALARRVLLTGAVAVVLGGTLALTQVLPTLELGRYSARGAGRPSADGFRFHQERALQPIELLSLLQADFLGTPVDGSYRGISYSEHCPFVGASTVALGLVGLALGWRRKHLWLFFGIGVFALWGAMAGPPAALLYWGVPKLGQAGGFSRLLSVWTLAASLWGGAGLQVVVERLGAGALSSAGRGLVPRPPSSTTSSDGAVQARAPQKTTATALAAFALLLLALEMLPWAYRFNPRADAGDVYPETPLISQMRERLGSERYVAINDRRAWGLAEVPAGVILPPNSATVYGLRCADGYDSLFPLAYRAFAGRMEKADPAPLANGNMLLMQEWLPWKAHGTSYVVTPSDAPPGRGSVAEADGLRLGGVFSLGASRSRRGYQCIPDAPLELLAEGLNHVKLDISEASNIPAIPVPIPPPGRVRVALFDSYYPGWCCTVDGRPEAIQPYDGAFRAITPAYRSRVADMVYYPASVACGLFLSLLALSALVALGTFRWGGRAQ